MKIYDISQEVFDCTVFPGDPQPERILMQKIESEDTATWWRILMSGTKAQGLDSVLTIYRRPARSLSSNKRTAVRRIWQLYRNVAGLDTFHSCICMVGWAVRATLRRL